MEALSRLIGDVLRELDRGLSKVRLPSVSESLITLSEKFGPITLNTLDYVKTWRLYDDK